MVYCLFISFIWNPFIVSLFNLVLSYNPSIKFTIIHVVAVGRLFLLVLPQSHRGKTSSRLLLSTRTTRPLPPRHQQLARQLAAVPHQTAFSSMHLIRPPLFRIGQPSSLDRSVHLVPATTLRLQLLCPHPIPMRPVQDIRSQGLTSAGTALRCAEGVPSGDICA